MTPATGAGANQVISSDFCYLTAACAGGCAAICHYLYQFQLRIAGGVAHDTAGGAWIRSGRMRGRFEEWGLGV